MHGSSLLGLLDPSVQILYAHDGPVGMSINQPPNNPSSNRSVQVSIKVEVAHPFSGDPRWYKWKSNDAIKFIPNQKIGTARSRGSKALIISVNIVSTSNILAPFHDR